MFLPFKDPISATPGHEEIFAFAAALVLATYVAVVYSIRSVSPKRTSNPGKIPSSTSRTAGPVDAVLYRASHPHESCDDEYDVIVIGSGIGGLTVASLLSKLSYKVLVLEQHTVCGGCCHSFKSDGYKFDTGIHYVAGLTGIHKSLLNSLTSEDEDPVAWDPLADNYDTVVLGTGQTARQYEYVSGGLEAQKLHLKNQFQDKDHDAIDQFYDMVSKVNAAFKASSMFKSLPLPITKLLIWTGLYKYFDGDFHTYSSTTVEDVVSSLTDNKDLQEVLSYGYLDYGCEPKMAPFIWQASLLYYFSAGAFYPRGGPENIARKIIPVITGRGGKVLAGAPVRYITTDDETGRAIGVEMKNGRRIKAKRAVVSDAGFSDTAQHLLPSSLRSRSKLLASLVTPHNNEKGNPHGLHSGVTGMSLFVGLKGDHDIDLHLPRSQYWAYPEGSAESFNKGFSRLQDLSLEDALKLKPHELPIFVGSPSVKDSTWKANYPGRTSMEILAYAPWAWFKEFAPCERSEGGLADPGGKPGSHGAKYEDAKRRLAEKMWARAVDVLSSGGATNLPRVLGEVDHYQIGSPLSFAHYFHRDFGTWYGLDNDLARYEPQNYYVRLRPEIPEVPGLYITGQDVVSDSFTAAMVGGLLCASKVSGASLNSLLHTSQA